MIPAVTRHRTEGPNRDRLGERSPAVGRRDLLKLGAGVVAATVGARQAPASAQRREAQAPPPGSVRQPDAPRPHTGPGYRNDANRLGANGPMDDTTRKVVKYVHDFGEHDLTAPVRQAIDQTMVDSMAAVISGFESEPVRIAARLSRLSPAGSLKSTVLGYGIAT